MHRTREKTTVGLTSTLAPEDEKYDSFRFFFFETDKPYNNEHFIRLKELYERNELDVLVHQTGGGGLHFKSPTLVTKSLWKSLMDQVKDINPKCPMVTLRTKPNKYCDESSVWTKSSVGYAGRMADNFNSNELSALLNHWFGTHFKGSVSTILRFVTYPLPRFIPTEKEIHIDMGLEA